MFYEGEKSRVYVRVFKTYRVSILVIMCIRLSFVGNLIYMNSHTVVKSFEIRNTIIVNIS
jgi:hypothetical protein